MTECKQFGILNIFYCAYTGSPTPGGGYTPLPPPPLLAAHPSTGLIDGAHGNASYTSDALPPLKVPHTKGRDDLRSSGGMDGVKADSPHGGVQFTPQGHTSRGAAELQALHKFENQSQVMHLADGDRPLEQFLPFRCVEGGVRAQPEA